MHETPPDEWAHPEVHEAVFDALTRYEFDSYTRGHRETVVYYRLQMVRCLAGRQIHGPFRRV
ncbi:hypothetical protein [Halorussus sp. MSC15.2]|uniref:hypothetical protein n=1 Tax=Halorussus sp. MSC15.2 TaxID=2283638 RepID=UPI0013D72126|nr:hypothetical protein [Halorussus sp. MSC15.2]NEU58795.1 hypothetical protein [Halorussus sp. MSC15.2]